MHMYRISEGHALEICLWAAQFLLQIALEHQLNCWYTANIVNISILSALSIGYGLEAAVLLSINRGVL